MFLAGVFDSKFTMVEYFNQLRRLLQAQGESFEEDVRKLVTQLIMLINKVFVAKLLETRSELGLDLDLSTQYFNQQLSFRLYFVYPHKF